MSRLVSWHELGCVVPGVVACWVSQVGIQVGDGALAGHDGLDEEAEHAEHGQATVLDLLHLQSMNQTCLVQDQKKYFTRQLCCS